MIHKCPLATAPGRGLTPRDGPATARTLTLGRRPATERRPRKAGSRGHLIGPGRSAIMDGVAGVIEDDDPEGGATGRYVAVLGIVRPRHQ